MSHPEELNQRTLSHINRLFGLPDTTQQQPPSPASRPFQDPRLEQVRLLAASGRVQEAAQLLASNFNIPLPQAVENVTALLEGRRPRDVRDHVGRLMQATRGFGTEPEVASGNRPLDAPISRPPLFDTLFGPAPAAQSTPASPPPRPAPAPVATQPTPTPLEPPPPPPPVLGPARTTPFSLSPTLRANGAPPGIGVTPSPPTSDLDSDRIAATPPAAPQAQTTPAQPTPAQPTPGLFGRLIDFIADITPGDDNQTRQTLSTVLPFVTGAGALTGLGALATRAGAVGRGILAALDAADLAWLQQMTGIPAVMLQQLGGPAVRALASLPVIGAVIRSGLQKKYGDFLRTPIEDPTRMLPDTRLQRAAQEEETLQQFLRGFQGEPAAPSAPPPPPPPRTMADFFEEPPAPPSHEELLENILAGEPRPRPASMSGLEELMEALSPPVTPQAAVAQRPPDLPPAAAVTEPVPAPQPTPAPQAAPAATAAPAASAPPTSPARTSTSRPARSGRGGRQQRPAAAATPAENISRAKAEGRVIEETPFGPAIVDERVRDAGLELSAVEEPKAVQTSAPAPRATTPPPAPTGRGDVNKLPKHVYNFLAYNFLAGKPVDFEAEFGVPVTEHRTIMDQVDAAAKQVGFRNASEARQAVQAAERGEVPPATTGGVTAATTPEPTPAPAQTAPTQPPAPDSPRLTPDEEVEGKALDKTLGVDTEQPVTFQKGQKVKVPAFGTWTVVEDLGDSVKVKSARGATKTYAKSKVSPADDAEPPTAPPPVRDQGAAESTTTRPTRQQGQTSTPEPAAKAPARTGMEARKGDLIVINGRQGVFEVVDDRDPSLVTVKNLVHQNTAPFQVGRGAIRIADQPASPTPAAPAAPEPQSAPATASPVATAPSAAPIIQKGDTIAWKPHGGSEMRGSVVQIIMKQDQPHMYQVRTLDKAEERWVSAETPGLRKIDRSAEPPPEAPSRAAPVPASNFLEGDRVRSKSKENLGVLKFVEVDPLNPAFGKLTKGSTQYRLKLDDLELVERPKRNQETPPAPASTGGNTGASAAEKTDTPEAKFREAVEVTPTGPGAEVAKQALSHTKKAAESAQTVIQEYLDAQVKAKKLTAADRKNKVKKLDAAIDRVLASLDRDVDLTKFNDQYKERLVQQIRPHVPQDDLNDFVNKMFNKTKTDAKKAAETWKQYTSDKPAVSPPQPPPKDLPATAGRDITATPPSFAPGTKVRIEDGDGIWTVEKDMGRKVRVTNAKGEVRTVDDFKVTRVPDTPAEAGQKKPSKRFTSKQLNDTMADLTEIVEETIDNQLRSLSMQPQTRAQVAKRLAQRVMDILMDVPTTGNDPLLEGEFQPALRKVLRDELYREDFQMDLPSGVRREKVNEISNAVVYELRNDGEPFRRAIAREMKKNQPTTPPKA